jgi:peroxiredoxin
MAPDFTLPDQDGRPVSLAQLLTASPDAVAPAGAGAPADAVQKANGVVLVFYRGYW